MKIKKKICFDIDNVICKTRNSDYKNSKPILLAIKKINQLCISIIQCTTNCNFEILQIVMIIHTREDFGCTINISIVIKYHKNTK